jgi:hypothetical protein
MLLLSFWLATRAKEQPPLLKTIWFIAITPVALLIFWEHFHWTFSLFGMDVNLGFDIKIFLIFFDKSIFLLRVCLKIKNWH